MLHRLFTEVQLLYRVGALCLQSGMSRAQQIPKCTMYMMRLCRHCQKNSALYHTEKNKMFHLLDRQGGGCTNPVTRVSDIMGWGLDVINKLAPRAAAAQHVYYCGNRNMSYLRPTQLENLYLGQT